MCSINQRIIKHVITKHDFHIIANRLFYLMPCRHLGLFSRQKIKLQKYKYHINTIKPNKQNKSYPIFF